MATKTGQEIVLNSAAGIENVFIRNWKKEFFKDTRKRIASISFMRNLVEYTRSQGDPDYVTLTSLLHRKEDSDKITHSDLDRIYKGLFSGNGTSWPHPNQVVIDAIDSEAQTCLTTPTGVNFEHKIVLAIAIRLAAEKFMIAKIADPVFVKGIKKQQTQRLREKYEEKFPSEANNIKILESVVLMTPENIHLNSFMYEPIIDMGDDELKELYKKVRNLK